MMNSWRPCVLIFSHSRVRLPGWYAESARLAMMPSELLLLRSGEQRLAVVEGLGETDGAVALVDQLLEARAPLDEGQLESGSPSSSIRSNT